MFLQQPKQFNPMSPLQNPIPVARKNAGNIGQGMKQYTQVDTGFKNNPTLPNPGGPYAHGNGGIFAVAGQQPQIFSVMSMPMAGLIDDLPILFQGLGNEFDGPVEFGGMSSPLHTYITGVTKGNVETLANQPTADCVPGPEAGLMKACTVTLPFGKYRVSIKLNIEQIGMLRDRADPTYLQLMNQPPSQSNLVPGQFGSAQNILMSEFNRRAWIAGVSFKRFLAGRIYAGNPVNSASSTNYKDIVGMDLQVNTNNKVDMFSSNVCTALNSTIFDFNSRMLAANGASLYQYLDMAFFGVLWNARREGLEPTTWKFYMRPEMFDEIVKIWPVEQYMEALTAIGAFANGRVTISGKETIDLRDQMREGMYLPLRGRLIPVVLDDTIAETDVTNNNKLSAGQYASDIYLIPEAVMGGLPVTYIQPFQQDNQMIMDAVTQGRLTRTFTSDGGLFRWYVYENGPCTQWDVMTQFRVRCHMPQLAARVQNVGYNPIAHVRSWNPDSAYFADGGRTNSPTQSFYTIWSPTTPVAIN